MKPKNKIFFFLINYCLVTTATLGSFRVTHDTWLVTKTHNHEYGNVIREKFPALACVSTCNPEDPYLAPSGGLECKKTSFSLATSWKCQDDDGVQWKTQDVYCLYNNETHTHFYSHANGNKEDDHNAQIHCRVDYHGDGALGSRRQDVDAGTVSIIITTIGLWIIVAVTAISASAVLKRKQ